MRIDVSSKIQTYKDNVDAELFFKYFIKLINLGLSECYYLRLGYVYRYQYEPAYLLSMIATNLRCEVWRRINRTYLCKQNTDNHFP